MRFPEAKIWEFKESTAIKKQKLRVSFTVPSSKGKKSRLVQKPTRCNSKLKTEQGSTPLFLLLHTALLLPSVPVFPFFCENFIPLWRTEWATIENTGFSLAHLETDSHSHYFFLGFIHDLTLELSPFYTLIPKYFYSKTVGADISGVLRHFNFSHSIDAKGMKIMLRVWNGP